MSCRTTTQGSLSTSIAKRVTGLSDKEITHIFHTLKREGSGAPQPTAIEVFRWQREQEALIGETRTHPRYQDIWRAKLFRNKSEPLPDGPTFYAAKNVEARARQEVAARSVVHAVDLAPAGSQKDQYDLGEDGRPKRIWYASYGSNLFEERFNVYIQGGSPPGSTKKYEGCTDKTPAKSNIPVRFQGASTHFALTSSVWQGGGVAFVDQDEKKSTFSFGRAYDISVEQFDQVVGQENGVKGSKCKPVDLTEVLETQRSITGPGYYETLIHIGDYQGAPVLSFTAPFSAQDAVAQRGQMVTKAKTVDIRTNKPSPAYLRMISNGLEETFKMNTGQRADILRGCAGASAYTRGQMLRIVEGLEPEPQPLPAKILEAVKSTFRK